MPKTSTTNGVSGIRSAAAALIIVIIAVGCTTDSAEPTDLSEPEASEPDGTDRDDDTESELLYLLPPDLDPELAENEIETETETGTDANLNLTLLAIGRESGDRLEDLILISHTSGDEGRIDDTRSQVVAGRELFSSFSGGIVEPLADDTSIEYDTELGDVKLEELVAATTVTDGQLTFDETATDLAVLGRIDNTRPRSWVRVSAEATSGDTSFAYTVITSEVDDVNDVLTLSVGFGLPSLEVTTLDGRPAFVFFDPAAGGSAFIGWSPTVDHVALMRLEGLDQEQILDFAAGFTPTDELTWRTTLGS